MQDWAYLLIKGGIKVNKQEISHIQKQERLGMINKNKNALGGYEMKIIEYNKATDIVVEFQDEFKAKIRTRWSSFKEGNIKNPYHKSLCNVGYLGEGNYKVSENGKHTKVYDVWVAMIQRCYDPYYLNKYQSYIDCYVCDEWLCFQNFAKWFYKNYYEINNEIMHLDKDILYKGNKIYSPQTCVFVPNNINVLFCKRNKLRGKCVIGVYWDVERSKFVSVCSVFEKERNKAKHKFIGRYNSEVEAFMAYKQFKENHIKQVADEYKDLIPKELYNAMYEYEVEIND